MRTSCTGKTMGFTHALLGAGCLTFLLFTSLVPITLRTVRGLPTTINVHPSMSNVNIGETFEINTTVIEVTNLTSWEFRLLYLNRIVNCTRVVEGSFLKRAGSTFKVFTITNDYNATHGRILASCTLLGQNVSASGNGTLATVTFEATTDGQTPLHLVDSKLGDEQIPPKPISHTSIGGIVNVGMIHDVAAIDLLFSKSITGQEYALRITATVENQGSFSETFDLSFYSNQTETGTQTVVSLTPTARENINFTWNTAGWTIGNYSMSIYVWPVPLENYTADNRLVKGWVFVTIPGDVDGDKTVTIYDIVRMACIYGASVNDPLYDPCTDINDDGNVDQADVAIGVTNYGQIA